MAAPLSAAPPLVAAGRYCGSGEPGVLILQLDTVTGALTTVASVAGIENPSWVAFHPEQSWLYAVEETGNERSGGGVVALRFDEAASSLELVNRRKSGGGAPCHVAIAPTGDRLAVTNYLSGSVAVFPIRADGSLGRRSDLQVHEGRGIHPDRQNGPHAHSSVFVAHGRFLLVTDLGTDEIVVYAVNGATGRLTRQGAAAASPGAGPRHMALGAARDLVAVSNELDSTMSLYRFDGEAGSMEPVARTRSVPVDHAAADNLPSEVAYAPGQRRLYVANRGHNSIAAFQLDDDGELQLIGTAPSGGIWPRHFAIDPSERTMLVAHEQSGWISVLALGGDRPGIGPELARFALPGASCVQFSGRSTS